MAVDRQEPMVLQRYRAKKNAASAKIVKIKFNANLDLLGSPFYNI